MEEWLSFFMVIFWAQNNVLGLRAFSLHHSAQFPLGTLAVLGSRNSFKENKRRILSSTGPNSAILSHILTPEPTSISMGNVVLLWPCQGHSCNCSWDCSRFLFSSLYFYYIFQIFYIATDFFCNQRNIDIIHKKKTKKKGGAKVLFHSSFGQYMMPSM